MPVCQAEVAKGEKYLTTGNGSKQPGIQLVSGFGNPLRDFTLCCVSPFEDQYKRRGNISHAVVAISTLDISCSKGDGEDGLKCQ